LVAGGGDLDAGMVDVDSGVVDVDAGTIGDDAGMGDVDAGTGGAPPNPAACVHNGRSVLLPTGAWVCDCPAGIWGDKCQTTTVEIAAASSGESACALKSDGMITCWGRGTAWQAQFSGRPYAHLAVGQTGACAIKADQTLQYSQNGHAAFAPPSGTFTQVSGGADDHYCALSTDGTATCWSPHGNALLSGTFVQIADGPAGSCGVHTNGELACWGNGYPQILTPTLVPPSGKFSSVAVGKGAACALDADGKMSCWSSDSSVLPGLPGTFTSISLGSGQVCGVRATGAVECSFTGLLPLPANERFVSVSLGTQTACGIHPDGSATCRSGTDAVPSITGGAANGPPAGTFSNVATGIGVYAIGIDGSLRFLAPPAPGQLPPPAGTFTQLSGDCALRTDHTVACWGSTSAPSGTFNAIAGNWAVTEPEGIRRTFGENCGVRTNGTLSCWAADGVTALVPPAGQYSRIFAGYKTFCAIDLGAQLHCWDRDGQSAPLSGSFTDGAIGWLFGADFYPLYENICALNTEGQPVCTLAVGPLPTDRYTSISGDLGHVCGVKTDGHLGCWGYIVGYADVNVPPGEFVSVDHSCGVRKDGQIACWGQVARPAQY
jgi:hypothetical protein